MPLLTLIPSRLDSFAISLFVNNETAMLSILGLQRTCRNILVNMMSNLYYSTQGQYPSGYEYVNM